MLGAECTKEILSKNKLKGKSHPISEKQKKTLREFRLGKSPGNKGKSPSEETKEKMRNAWILRRKKLEIK